MNCLIIAYITLCTYSSPGYHEGQLGKITYFVAGQVEEKLKDGWQPYGDPYYSGYNACQAMVQYDCEATP